MNFQFTNEELEQELNNWTIIPVNGGYATSYATLYKTDYTTVAAKAFHIPNHETGELHHFNISLRKFKRKKKSEVWEEVEPVNSENLYGFHRRFDIDSGDGKAVIELGKFINAQIEFSGKKINTETVLIEKSDSLDVDQIIKGLNSGQKEELGIGVRVDLLKSYKKFLEENLDKNEKFIQDWLDEDGGKYRKQRCLIFGLEFIDHKREGELARKRFDILTRTSLTINEYVIVELKSPKDEVFDIKEVENTNGGTTTEYHLSKSIARAIPQILNYKSMIDSKKDEDEDLQRIGIQAGKICKCIILIGKRHQNAVWEKNLLNIKQNFSNMLEIWTYSDLINKLNITIKNLEENLRN
jgi:hypothetical protein